MMDIILPVIIVSAIGLIAGLGLSIASKYLSEPADEVKEQIRAALPGANCGACGFAGCDDYAAAIRSGEADAGRCTVGGKETAATLSEILGIEVEAKEKRAFVTCKGDCHHAQTQYAYSGMQSCYAAKMLYNGPLVCTYGCIGLGDCEKVCEKNAITISESLARVDRDLCAGCGKCADVCPNSVIKILDADYKSVVSCNSNDKGAKVNKACDVGCIGCMKCVKVCPSEAIKIENFLAVIDQTKCTGCDECILICPRGIISK